MPKKPFYSQTPVVPPKKIAGTNPVGRVTLGEQAPPMVPRHEGRSKAFGPPKQAHGFGHKVHQKHGHLRTSGHVNAHQVGWPRPKVMKVPK